MAEPKTDCTGCGREILTRTAERNNGMCKPCFREAERYSAYLNSQAVYREAGPSISGFRNAFIEFTEGVETIFNNHPVCQDTAVRDEICGVLQKTLLNGNTGLHPQASYATMDPAVDASIQKLLQGFLGKPIVHEFIQQHADELRIKLIGTMMTDRSVVSSSGEDLYELLGEWV